MLTGGAVESVWQVPRFDHVRRRSIPRAGSLGPITSNQRIKSSRAAWALNPANVWIVAFTATHRKTLNVAHKCSSLRLASRCPWKMGNRYRNELLISDRLEQHAYWTFVS